jgi:hypothetical protein
MKSHPCFHPGPSCALRIHRLPRRATGAARIGAALLFLSAAGVFGAVHEVGPDQALGSIGEVPWASLNAGDEVRIHWRKEPYREKWVLCRQGTDDKPIVVRGVPNRFGELPVISGENAMTPAGLDFWGEERGLLKIGGANVPADSMPAHIVIEDLEFRGAYRDYTFTDDHGATKSYADNAAAIYVEKAKHLTIRRCILTDSGNGLFAGPFGGETEDIAIEFCRIRGNGNPGRIYEHNSYTEADGIRFEGNCYGPLRTGAGGNNLKDRSAGTVIRHNWIEGGNRQLDLVESEALHALPSYSTTYVYGNVLVERGDEGNNQILHYGGDGGDTDFYRKGTLHFFHNTVVSVRSGNTTVFRLSTNAESADCRNNIFYITQPGDRLAWLDGGGTLAIRNNWAKSGIVPCHGTLAGTIDDQGGGVRGTAPGFVDGGQPEFTPQQREHTDFHLAAGSACIDAATGSPRAVTREYLKPRRTTARHDDGHPDIGAFEHDPDVSAIDDFLFIHHSCGNNWLDHYLRNALTDKDWVDEYNNIYYGTDLPPDPGRPDSLASTPGDRTDMNHWVRWFNDYLGGVISHNCADGVNRVIMFKSCYPNSNVESDGTPPGDPFSGSKTLANYKAAYRHATGPGHTYTYNGATYKPLEDIFAEHPEILFIPVTAPPLHQGTSTDANAHRARLFNNWLKNEWLPGYLDRHPGLHNVAVLDWFDFLANPDAAATKPNRLKTEYGGTSGNSHPNTSANECSTDVFAVQRDNLLDAAWDAFRNADHDADAMPDWWERNHGFDPSDPSDAGSDPDGDRSNNAAEYIADTDPANPLDWFRAERISTDPSPITVHFHSSSARFYTLESSPDLSEGSWTPVPGAGSRPGVGGPDSMQDPDSPPPPTRFYRVRVSTQ